MSVIFELAFVVHICALYRDSVSSKITHKKMVGEFPPDFFYRMVEVILPFSMLYFALLRSLKSSMRKFPIL